MIPSTEHSGKGKTMKKDEVKRSVVFRGWGWREMNRQSTEDF